MSRSLGLTRGWHRALRSSDRRKDGRQVTGDADRLASGDGPARRRLRREAASDSGIASLQEEDGGRRARPPPPPPRSTRSRPSSTSPPACGSTAVDMPDPEISSAGGGFAFGITVEGSAEGGAPDNTELRQMQEASEACNHFLEGVVQEFEAPDMSEMQDQMLAFARCMREHGVDMPDPEFSEDGAVSIFGPGNRARPSRSTPATRLPGSPGGVQRDLRRPGRHDHGRPGRSGRRSSPCPARRWIGARPRHRRLARLPVTSHPVLRWR